MDAKLNSVGHKENVFNVLSFFKLVWLISLQKVLIWPQKNFPKYFQYGYQKMQNLMPTSNPLKKYQESLHEEN